MVWAARCSSILSILVSAWCIKALSLYFDICGDLCVPDCDGVVLTDVSQRDVDVGGTAAMGDETGCDVVVWGVVSDRGVDVRGTAAVGIEKSSDIGVVELSWNAGTDELRLNAELECSVELIWHSKHLIVDSSFKSIEFVTCISCVRYADT